MAIKLKPDELVGAVKWHIHKEFGTVSNAAEKLGLRQSNLSLALNGSGGTIPPKILKSMGLSEMVEYTTNA